MTAPLTTRQDSMLLPVADSREVRRAIAALCRPYRTRIVAAALVLVLGTATLLIAPPLLGEIVDRVLEGRPESAITGPVLALFVVAVVAGLLDALGRAQVAAIGEPVLAELREDVVRAALHASADTIERAGSGDVVSRVSGDTEAVSQLIGESLPRLVRSALLIALTFVGLAALDWRLALAGLAAVPVQAFALRRYLRVAGPMYAAERIAEGARAQQLLATISGAPTVRAYRLGAVHRERVDARCRDAVTIALRTTAEQTRFYARLNGAELAGTAAVLIAGFLLVRSGEISVGAATAGALYFIRLFDPINTVLGLVDDAQEASAALARLVGVTSLPARITGAAPHPPVDAGVVVAGVSHAYPGAPPVLHEVDLTLRPGERVALVGASGAGKTTLARLIAGTLSPTAGRVTVGGVTVTELARDTERTAVVLVSQDVHTFAGTLAEDLRLARPEATDPELGAALATVRADAWLAALPAGLETRIGAGGHRLTPTQAQQLALARLVLADPLVAILDEATAEAGSAGARVLEAAADAALAGRTALVVAHRLTQAAAADRVVVLEAGRVVEQGTHAELATGTGPYAQLWAAWSRSRGEREPDADSFGG